MVMTPSCIAAGELTRFAMYDDDDYAPGTPPVLFAHVSWIGLLLLLLLLVLLCVDSVETLCAH